MSTPKEAMKQFCRECVSGDVRHVTECQGDTVACPLFKYRLKEGKISVKVLRKACLDCMGESRDLVFTCPTETCPLYEYRLGKNEAHKNRVGNIKSILQNRG